MRVERDVSACAAPAQQRHQAVREDFQARYCERGADIFGTRVTTDDLDGHSASHEGVDILDHTQIRKQIQLWHDNHSEELGVIIGSEHKQERHTNKHARTISWRSLQDRLPSPTRGSIRRYVPVDTESTRSLSVRAASESS